MAPSEDLQPLLEEIRDVQREHLAEYRRVTQQSAGGVLMLGTVVVILYVLSFLGSYL